MKLITYKNNSRIGVQVDNFFLDLRLGYAVYLFEKEGIPYEEAKDRSEKSISDDMISFIQLGEKGIKLAHETLNYFKTNKIHTEVLEPINRVNLDPPIPKPPKDIICIGRNYYSNVEKAGLEIPDYPSWFIKTRSAIVGPLDHIILPDIAKKVNHGTELAVVIGKGGKMIPESEAMGHVFGYTILNDLGADTRCIGKNFYTFAPLGPYLVTKDQIKDPQNLNVELIVNNKKIAEGNTKNMIFKIPYLISFISSLLSLETGDIIATGTPIDIGPLNPGDVVEAVVEDIGTLKNVVSYSRAKIESPKN